MKQAVIGLLALMLLSLQVPGQELQLREKLWTEVRYLYDRSDFDALEAMYQKLANPAERFPSGVPKLMEFYGVFQCGCSTGGARLELDAMQTVEARALEWRRRFPNSNAAQIALAYTYNSIGTLYRGTGLADTVNPADWKKWKEYGEKAYRVLMERGDAPRADPQWYGAMFVTLLRYQTDTEEFPRLFEEGMRRHPVYPELYFAAAYYDSPLWRGSLADMESVAQAAVRASAATEGKSMYARVYWYLDNLPTFNGRIFTETFARWPAMREGFEDLVQRYPDPWNLNRYAFFACNAGDRATYSDVIKRIGPRVDYGAWNS